MMWISWIQPSQSSFYLQYQSLCWTLFSIGLWMARELCVIIVTVTWTHVRLWIVHDCMDFLWMLCFVELCYQKTKLLE